MTRLEIYKLLRSLDIPPKEAHDMAKKLAPRSVFDEAHKL